MELLAPRKHANPPWLRGRKPNCSSDFAIWDVYDSSRIHASARIKKLRLLLRDILVQILRE